MAVERSHCILILCKCLCLNVLDPVREFISNRSMLNHQIQRERRPCKILENKKGALADWGIFPPPPAGPVTALG